MSVSREAAATDQPAAMHDWVKRVGASHMAEYSFNEISESFM